jgi:hypothetical protein
MKKIFLCKMCLNKFDSEINLKAHKTYCDAYKSTRIEMPKPYDIIQFKNYNHSLNVLLAVYVDYECMLQKIQTCQPSDEMSYTNTYQKHVPNNFVYHVKYANGDFKPPVEYSRLDAPKVFCQKLEKQCIIYC